MKEYNVRQNIFFKYLLYIFLLIPFFKIPYLVYKYDFVDDIYKIWQIISGFIILLIILKNGTFSKIIGYILLFLFTMFLSSIINSQSLLNIISFVFHVFVLCLVVDYGISNDTKLFLNSFEMLLSILICVNFLTVITYPEGMYINNLGFRYNWLLGYKNSHISYVMPAIFISFINSYYTFNKLKLRNILLLIISIISTIMVDNSTGLFALSLISCFLLLSKLFKKRKNILNIFSYSIINISLFFGIVIARVQNYFSTIIVDVLHRDLTFTGRTYIWDKVLLMIQRSKIFGYGKTFQYTDTIVSSHNQILEILYKNGILGLIGYLLVVFNSFRELWKYREYKVVQFMSFIMFTYFVMMLTEAYSHEYIIYLYVICYHTKFLVKEKNV